MKTIVVSGATGELGTAILPRFEREYRCVVLRRNDDPSSIADELHGIVNLAGAFTTGSSLDDFARMLDANLLSAVKTIGGVAPRLQDGGRIVAVSSVASLQTPAGLGAYAASKAALNAYLRVLAKELAPRHITVNAIAPSALDTPSMRNAMRRDQLVPLDRVAETILFLLSDAGGAITGQVIALSA